MQGRHEYQPELFTQIDYEALIPKGHLLRKIDGVLDLRFLPEMTKPLYAQNLGRPSIDPEVFVRMVLLCCLYDIKSDRQLCEEIGYNFAYRWFCRLSLSDRVPDHSSMTKIRDRLGEDVYAKIFLNVVEQCKRAGLIKAEQIMMDGSVIRANASIYYMEERADEKAADAVLPTSEQEASVAKPIYSKDGLSNNDFRQRGIEGKKISNKTHVSKSDPEATLCGKAFESKSLAYKTHHAIDADSRVIIDCHVTTGATSEVKVMQSRIDAIEKNIDLHIGEVIADRGYGSGENLEFLEDRGTRSNIPLWNTRSGETFFKEIESGFRLSENDKTVTCPEGHAMKFSVHEESTGRDLFVLPRSLCIKCPRAKVCLTESEFARRGKRFTLIDHHKIISATNEKSKLPEFRSKLWQRMWKMEWIFAEAKSHHGLRRARYRGRAKVQMQIYMISVVQNLKRLARAIVFWFNCILANFIKIELSPAKLRKTPIYV